MNLSMDAVTAPTSPTAIISTTSYEFMSSDELMLQELERRDGIYSFIFHELESDKTITITPSPSSTSSATIYTATTTNNDHNYFATPTTDNTSNDSQNYKLRAETKLITVCSESVPRAETSTNTTATATTTFIASSNNNAQYHNPTNTASLFNGIPQFQPLPAHQQQHAVLPPYQPSYPSPYQHTLPSMLPPLLPPPPPHYPAPRPPQPPPAQMAAPTATNQYQLAWPAWTTGRHIGYDPTTLHTYMANLGLRVRKPKARFSHITTPLVRNRQHELKNTSEYMCLCEARIVKVPDLRSLFPYDPDVHAPFCAQTPTVRDLHRAKMREAQ